MSKILGVDFLPYTSTEGKAIAEAKPTFIGKLDGLRYFEHPFYGDESPLIVIINGTWYLSTEWEI